MKKEIPKKLNSVIEKFKEEHPEIIERKDCDLASYRFYLFSRKNLAGEVDYYPLENFPLNNGRHVINRYGDIVIDWTMRQFKGFEDVPVPFVYKLEEDNKYLGGVPSISDKGEYKIKKTDKDNEKLINLRKNFNEGGLEKSLVLIMGIFGLSTSLIFLSSNLTGKVIGSLTQTSSNIIGGTFFLVGLIGAFIYFKKKSR